jgi:hypothetical protein
MGPRRRPLTIRKMPFSQALPARPRHHPTVRRGALVGILCAVAACTGGAGSSNPPLGLPTSTIAASTTEQACDGFEQYWVESAQIYSGLHAFGDDSQDPHLRPAEDALAQAVSLAKTGPPELQELGRQAELQYNTGAPADFLATVKSALAVCGRMPPPTVCSTNTICETEHMDTY